MKTRRPRASFVVTVSLLVVTACGKEAASSSGECKPPDCHINPPPQPTPTPTETIHANPPAFEDSGPPPPRPTINANPPPIARDAGGPKTK